MDTKKKAAIISTGVSIAGLGTGMIDVANVASRANIIGLGLVVSGAIMVAAGAYLIARQLEDGLKELASKIEANRS